MTAPHIDLLSPASFAAGHPHEQYRWLRANAPAYWHDEPGGPGFWALTRYTDVQAVSRDQRTFSSSAAGVMIPDPPAEALAAQRRMMLYMDPPEHTSYRALVNRGFTPRASARWAERIQRAAERIVDAVAARGECDLVGELAGEMPAYVVAELMGIPLPDARRLYLLTETMHSADPGLGEAERMAAVFDMLGYAAGVAADRRARPREDLASLLVTAEVDGRRLSDEEFCWFFLLLVNAGGDTTRNLLAGGVAELLDHPAELDRLRGGLDPLLPTAVEELLRFVSPVVHMRRTATRDVVLAGTRVRAGEKVVVYYGAANRDETVFTDPDRLDLAREPNPHVAFGGGGAHFCLGAHFARLETAAMLRAMLTRLADLRPAGPAEPLVSNFICGPRHYPLAFRAAG